MEKRIFCFMMLLLIFISGCDKEDVTVTPNPEVESWIQQLKAGEYDSNRLPEFAPEDIPSLLHYRNEKLMITGMPGNPISSLLMQDCRLGIYVLWTIESLRLKAIGSNLTIMGFPSQNPVLALRNAEELKLVTDDKSHTTAAKAYYDWWYGNSGKSFDTFSHIDPLASTNYRWH